MKRCPSCQRTYTDDTLRFCLEDGATLLGGASGSSDPLASTLLDSPPPTTGSDRSAPTEVLHSGPTSDNPASPTRSWGTPNVQPTPASSWDARRYSGQQSAPFSSTPPAQQVERKRSWLGALSLIIGVVTWMMMIAAFVGAGFKLRDEFIGFSFLAALFLSIFGVAFGIVAFGIAFKNPDRYGGKAMALIGLFMCLMPILFMLLLLAIGIAVMK
jgi:hypothetical protein